MVEGQMDCERVVMKDRSGDREVGEINREGKKAGRWELPACGLR